MPVQEARVGPKDRTPTEAEPETGAVTFHIGVEEVVLSEGVRWIEPDGCHVFRSLEFDVVAGARTFEEALSKFIDGIFEFAVYLGELEDPAENEEEMLHQLAPRLFRMSREVERCLESDRKRPLVSLNLRSRRHGREDVREWRPSRQRGLQVPSPA